MCIDEQLAGGNEIANVCNGGDRSKAQYEIRFTGRSVWTGNQGSYMLLGGGNGLIWEHKNTGTKNHWCGITIVGSGDAPRKVDWITGTGLLQVAEHGMILYLK